MRELWGNGHWVSIMQGLRIYKILGVLEKSSLALQQHEKYNQVIAKLSPDQCKDITSEYGSFIEEVISKNLTEEQGVEAVRQRLERNDRAYAAIAGTGVLTLVEMAGLYDASKLDFEDVGLMYKRRLRNLASGFKNSILLRDMRKNNAALGSASKTHSSVQDATTAQTEEFFAQIARAENTAAAIMNIVKRAQPKEDPSLG
jgi:hypothetical protein